MATYRRQYYRHACAPGVAVLFLSGVIAALGGQSPDTFMSAGGNGRSFSYSDGNGMVQYVWLPPAVGDLDSLGLIRVVTQPVAGAGGQIEIPMRIEPSGGALAVSSAIWTFGVTPTISGKATPARTIAQLIVTLTAGTNLVRIAVNPTLAGKTLLADIVADAPLITALDAGSWPAALAPHPIPVPYYSGTPFYFPALGLFANSYFDWQRSNASQINSGQAVYGALTDGSRNLLRERFNVSVSSNFTDVLPSPRNHKSNYLAQVSGRTVLDIEGGPTFSGIAQGLAMLGDYGLKNCVVIIHNWQRSGFDNALPAQYPAQAALGGDDGLRQAVAAGESNGCYVAVHENYVDYYPDYDYFTTSAIARTSNGQWELAWMNYLKIQSFATKPTWYLKNAATQSPEIHQLYNTNASFIDVNSSMEPWWRADMDAGTAGAGTFAAGWNASADLWSYESQTHAGPVFGEGCNHWYWSGLLDGVEAQFGAGGVFSNASSGAPLFVDFDLLKIHPAQVNHGMGYYERWQAAGEDMSRTGLVDAYRMQEIAYGHAPYVGSAYWQNLSRVLTEQNLVSPVARRYGTQTVDSIRYQVNGQWTDTNAAVKAGDWSRVQIRYTNGDTVVANTQPQSLAAGGLELPQYGWMATGTGLLAYTALRGGLIADYAGTPGAYFANARNQADLNASGAVAQPSVAGFSQTAARTAQIRMQWKVLDASSLQDSVEFVHFVPYTSDNSIDTIAFNPDHMPAVPTSQWMPGQVIQDVFQINVPASVADGKYSMRVGLYQGAQRFPLLGVNDGQLRYIVGTLSVGNGGQTMTFTPQAPVPLPADARLNAMGAVVDFGTMRTDGMVSLEQDGKQWFLRAYPRYRNVTVQLNAAQFPPPASLLCGSAAPQTPVVVHGYWQVDPAGAKVCSWPSQ